MMHPHFLFVYSMTGWLSDWSRWVRASFQLSVIAHVLSPGALKSFSHTPSQQSPAWSFTVIEVDTVTWSYRALDLATGFSSVYGVAAYNGQIFAPSYASALFRIDAATFTIVGSPLSLPGCTPYGGQTFSDYQYVPSRYRPGRPLQKFPIDSPHAHDLVPAACVSC